jgi:phage tail sheath protein FI
VETAMLSYTTPGVHIEEIPATGPIEGVGTSTPAFIGPALGGPINTPVKITNWTQFKDEFGDYMVGPPRFYMAYAVKGFFDNGGTVAYIVRVGTAQRAFLDLADRGEQPGVALHVEAQLEGPAGNGITVQVQDTQIVPTANNAKIHKDRAPINSASANLIVLTNLADAVHFRAGDWVTVEGTNERALIDHIIGPDLFLASNLNGQYSAGSFVRVADLVVNQKRFRVDNNAGLEPGSVIRMTQQATTEDHVVSTIAAEFVTISGSGLVNVFALDQNSQDVAVQSFEFTLIVTNAPHAPENFPNLSMDTRHSRYWGRIVTSSYVNVLTPQIPSVQPPPANRPAVIGATNLAGGTADNPGALGPNQYNHGLSALVPILDVQLVCVPDRTDQAVQQAVIAHCESLKDRFAILDAAKGQKPDASQGSPLMTQRAWCDSAGGYASLYYPWIAINDPSSLTGTDTILVPSSGHVAGIYARSDANQGVHKAPANEFVVSAVGLEVNVDDVTQGQLNIAGIDVHRIFPGGARPVVWGARTTTPPEQTAWRYNSVRRLFIFVETSLKMGLRPAVFQPNDLTLWKKLNRTITDFLTRVWRSGALFGSKPAEAFYVKIDEELNPPSVRALGQVIIEIGMAPVRPAEFVIVRIGIWDGGASISEQ